MGFSPVLHGEEEVWSRFNGWAAVAMPGHRAEATVLMRKARIFDASALYPQFLKCKADASDACAAMQEGMLEPIDQNSSNRSMEYGSTEGKKRF
jgi:hypothetical protein